MNRTGFSFDGKFAVVTGGSSGIGRQIAADLLRRGCRVVIASNSADALSSAVGMLAKISPQIAALECDVGDQNCVLGFAARVLKDHGCPDILINDAGFATYRPFCEAELGEVERLVSVNLLGAMRCTRVFLPHLIENGGGVVANMASIAGRMIITPNATYCGAKHALVAWSEALSYEVARFSVRLHVICPGRVETAFFDHETFKNRAPRAETRLTITVEDVSRATLNAIARNQFLTYVPWTLGLGVWLTNTLPFLVKPIYGRLLQSRMDSIYSSKVQ